MQTVDLKAYWEQVSRFSQYPEDKRALGYRLGLRAEAGELAGALDKYLRKKYDREEMVRRALDEASDICWYTCAYISLGAERWFPRLTDDSVYFTDGTLKLSLEELIEQITFHAYEHSMRAAPHFHHSWRTFSYIAMLAELCDTTLQAVLENNVAKLTERYGQ